MASKKKSTKKRFEWLYKLELWFAESLVVLSVFLLIMVVIFLAVVRSKQVADIAAALPAEQTTAFIIVSVRDYQKSADALPEEATLAVKKQQQNFESLFGPLDQLDWFAGDVGLALIEDEEVYFLTTRSKKQSLEYYQSLLQEGEELIEHKAGHSTVYEFSSGHPFSFSFFGNFVALSFNPETLKQIATRKDTLKSNSHYQNVRSRLPYSNSAYFYVNLPQARLHLVQAMALLGVDEPGFLEPLLRVYPAFGGTISMEEDGWYMETFTAVDKSLLSNEGLPRKTTKYQQNLLPYTLDDSLMEWGSVDATSQIQRTQDVLSQLHSAAAILFSSVINVQTEKWFGEKTDLETEIYPLLDREYWFAWNEGSFALLLELEEGEATQVYGWRDRYVKQVTVKEPVLTTTTNLSGQSVQELQARILPLTLEEKGAYALLNTELGTYGAIAILDNLLVITKTEADMQTILDRVSGDAAPRELSKASRILSGSEEMFVLQIDELPEEHLLSTMLEGFASLASTRKIFDDGVFARHSLLFE